MGLRFRGVAVAGLWRAVPSRATGRRRVAVVAVVAVFAGLVSSPTTTRAESDETVVLPAAGSGKIDPRYVKRANRSLRQSAKRLTGVAMAKATANPAACAVDAQCVARVGANAGAKRAVGVLIAQKRGKAFELSLLLVECATGRELLRKSHEIKKSKGLRRDPGSQLGQLLARAQSPTPKPADPPDTQPADSAGPAPAKVVLRTDETVVLPISGRGKVKARYVKRSAESIASAVGKLKRVSLATASPAGDDCSSTPACIARAGAEAGVERAVGVEIRPSGRRFALVITVVDVATERVLSRTRFVAKHSSALHTVPGKRLREILAPGPAARNSTGDSEWPPLSAKAKRAAVGDGRTATPITVLGGPPRNPSELRSAPELPFVSCQGATSLPATRKAAPAIIAPPFEARTTLSCLARRRGAETEFALTVVPPGPGLYASAPPRVRAQDPPLQLRSVVRDARGFRPPAKLRARASGGLVRVGAQGKMILELPPGKAPRMIVVALADGERAGATFVPTRGLSKLKVEAESRAKVRVRIGGEWSGPITARKGVAWVPIEAPPGVARAVVRATNRAGYATESVADLRVPSLPRIAAVAADADLAPGDSTQIVIGAAAANGRPAPKKTKLEVDAKLGVVGTPSARGSGVWVVPYTAPSAPGQDEVVIRVAGDASAGAVVLPIATSSGGASRVRVTLAEGPFGPGDELSGIVAIRDEQGNEVRGAEVSVDLGGSPATVEHTQEGTWFRARVPARVPDDHPLFLAVSSGRTRTRLPVETRIANPVTATIASRPAPRSAHVSIQVRDQHGNLVDPEFFTLHASGATFGRLVRRGGAYSVTLEAQGMSRVAVVRIDGDEGPLVTERIRLGAAHRFLLGAYADGGWMTDLDEFSAARAGAGIFVERSVGTVDASLRLGLEGFSGSGEGALGSGRDGSWSLTGFSVPVFFRFRLPMTRKLGLFAGVGVLPSRVSVEVTPNGLATEHYSEIAVATRWLVGLGVRVGPGRLQVGAAYGTGRLSEGLVTSHIEGAAALAGYEWGFVNLAK